MEINWRDGIGFGLLLLFAFFLVAGTSIALGALGLMLMAGIADARRFATSLARSYAFWAALALALYVLARALAAARLQPDRAGLHYASLWPWLLLFTFLLAAWFSRGQPRRVMAVMIAAALGLGVAVARLTDWSFFVEHVWTHGGRAYFGMTYLMSALLLGTFLLGWIALAERLIGRGPWRWLRGLTWFAVAALVGEMVFLTQSRAVLLSLIVLVPCLALIKVLRQPTRRTRLAVFVVFLACLTAVAALGYANRGSIAHRMGKTMTTLRGMETLQLADVPKTSLGKRIYLYTFGVQRWSEKPVFGWGPGMEAATMLPGAPIDPKTDARFPDLHDGYLEVLVRYGILGFVLTLILAATLIAGFYRAWRRGFVKTDVALFLVFAAALAALANLTNFRLVHVSYRFYTILLLGLIFGHELQMRTPGFDGRLSNAQTSEQA